MYAYIVCSLLLTLTVFSRPRCGLVVGGSIPLAQLEVPYEKVMFSWGNVQGLLHIDALENGSGFSILFMVLC